MDPKARAELIQRFRSGTTAFRRAAEGVAEADLDRRPSPGDWTPREIIHHMADAEMRSAIRLRQLIAEDTPTIQGYDEETYARRLHFERPIGAAVTAMEAARETSASLLDALTEDEWNREGMHTESGPYSVEEWLRVYAAHAHDHAEQLLRALGR